MPVGVLPRLEMVADEYRIEADLLGQTREVEQFARPELFGRRLVSEFQQLLLLLWLSVRGAQRSNLGGSRLLRCAGNDVYTLASTSSRKRRILASISSAVAPSKLKS